MTAPRSSPGTVGLSARCADFKANHDMGYSADDLTAFVAAEIDHALARAEGKSKLPGYTQFTDFRP